MDDRQIFLPRNRVLFDLTLIYLVLLLMSMVLFQVEPVVIGMVSVISVLIACGIWFGWIRRHFKIIIADGKIEGPKSIFGRDALMLRKINHRRIYHWRFREKFFRYRRIWSTDNKSIFLQYLFLGKPEIVEILGALDRYPFRET